MPEIWPHYILALATVGAFLAVLSGAAKILARYRIRVAGKSRLMTVIESQHLTPAASMHIVRIDSRDFIVGATNHTIRLLAELSYRAEGADKHPESRCSLSCCSSTRYARSE